MKQFLLHIEMGNDGMNYTEDVAAVLEQTARDIQKGKTKGAILDVMGNRVGGFEFK